MTQLEKELSEKIAALETENLKLRKGFEEIISWCPKPDDEKHCYIAECELARSVLRECKTDNFLSARISALEAVAEAAKNFVKGDGLFIDRDDNELCDRVALAVEKLKALEKK